MSLPPPKQWEWTALLPIAAGLYAILMHAGIAGLILGIVPGALVLAAGMALLLMPGDPRITGYMALGSAIGIALAVPLALFMGLGHALVAAALFLGAFLVAGRVSLEREARFDGVPPPPDEWRVQAKAAVDEAMLGYFVTTARVPSGDDARQMCEDALKLETLLSARGWLAHPERYHRSPETPRQINVQTAQLFGFEYEQVSFDSGFQPEPEIPGAESWLRHESNGRTVAWVMRHPGPPRPWLMCLHGYRMGRPSLDFSMFRPAHLFDRLGLNLIMPVLPLHGPRKIGVLSGDRYLDGNVLDLLFAQTQALWDLRRWLLWLRSVENDPTVGVWSVSLGAYNAALLAQYEAELDFVVTATPVVDLGGLLWRFVPPAHQRYYSEHGLAESRFRDILRVVSPLQRPPLPDASRLHIIGGTADRVVLPIHPMKLAEHWKVPVNWYNGSHQSLRREQEPRRVLEEAMLRAGWRAGTYAVA